MAGSFVTLLGEDVVRSVRQQEDPVARQRAYVYLEELKNSEWGWQMCLNALGSETNQDNYLQFFGFQIVEHYVKTRYDSAGPTEQQQVRQFIRQWIELRCMPHAQPGPPFILNKAAQIFSMIFVRDYPLRWPNFFDDLIATLNLGHQAVDNYLRVLKAIDVDVADREVLRTQAEAERNAKIKDTMRVSCIPKLVETWFQILKTYEVSHPDIVVQCLDVLGAYVSWIDITLVANDRFINQIIHLTSSVAAREAAVDCLYYIIAKGMDPLEKLRLVESLFPILEKQGILNPLKEDETDYTSKVGRLVNGIGMTLIEGRNKLLKEGVTDQAELLQYAIEGKVRYMLEFLKNDYDEVSASVFEFSREYIHMLKGKYISAEKLQVLETMLLTIAHKMKFDESYDFETEGEDEATFQDYRKQLKVLLENIAGVNKELVIDFVKKYIEHVVWHWQDSTFQDVEVAISLFYFIGEAIPAVGGNHFSGDQAKASAMHAMMTSLVTSGVSSHIHPAVTIQYLETVVRYDKFFVTSPEHLPDLFLTFLDCRGMRNKSSKIRSRSAYLFSRLVKSLKSSITSPLATSVLHSLHDYLLIPIPGSGVSQEWVSEDDQLYLYEATSILIVSADYPSEQKALAFQEVLFPILEKYNSMVAELMKERDEQQQEVIAKCMCHSMAVTSRMSKAFSSKQTMKSCNCVDVFVQALKVFLGCLLIPNQEAMLHSSLRQFLHRMVVCLEDEILPFVPQASEGLLKQSDITSVKEYVPLIVQIIAKFKKNILPFLQQALVPIVNAVFSCLSIPVEENDEEAKREKQLLKRSYFQLIAAIFQSNVAEVFNFLESTFVEQVLMSVIQGAVDFPDPIAQKTCFSILKKLVELAGGKELPGDFNEFIFKNVVPACILAPLRNTFDLCDAQTVVALAESALCLKAVLDKRGDELVKYLQNEYLPSLQIPPQLAEEYCRALKSDIKTFKDYIKSFSLKLRT